jgi:hypothetical protein
MRVLFRALLVMGAVAIVYRLHGHGAANAPTPTVQTSDVPPSRYVASRAAPTAQPQTVTFAPAATDAYRGVVIDGETGKPVEDVQVMLCRGIKDGHPACADSIASADTDESGRFEIERPDEPVGALVVDDDDYAPAIVQSPVGLSRVELWPSARVTGHVVDGKGNPVTGARVGWMLPGAELRLDASSETDESDGYFRIDRLPAGEVMLYAISGDHHTTTARLSLGRGERRNLELVMDDAEPLKVRGLVQDRTGRQLAFVQVTIEARSDLSAPDADALLAADQRRNVSSDIDGEFEVDFHSPGPHQLSFWAWDKDTGDLLAEAQVTASADPPVIKIPVWDPNVVVCHLEGDDGQTEPFTEYRFSYTLAGEEESGGAVAMGMMGGGNKGKDQLAFVWPRRIQSIDISLEGQSAAGSVVLRGPLDRCVPRGSR